MLVETTNKVTLVSRYGGGWASSLAKRLAWLLDLSVVQEGLQRKGYPFAGKRRAVLWRYKPRSSVGTNRAEHISSL